MPNTNAFCNGKHLGLGSKLLPHAFGSPNKAAGIGALENKSSLNKAEEIGALENKSSLNKAEEIEALENKNSSNKAEEMEALENKHFFPEEGMYVTKNKPAEIAALEGKHGELNPQPLPPVYNPSSTPTPPKSGGGIIDEGPDGIGVLRSPDGGPVIEEPVTPVFPSGVFEPNE